MKKTFKKLISVVLVVLMVFSLETPAFAAELNATTKSADLRPTITLDKKDYQEGEEIKITVETKNNGSAAEDVVLEFKTTPFITMETKIANIGTVTAKDTVTTTYSAVAGTSGIAELGGIFKAFRIVFGYVLPAVYNFVTLLMSDKDSQMVTIGDVAAVVVVTANRVTATPETPGEPEIPEVPEEPTSPEEPALPEDPSSETYTVTFNSNGGTEVAPIIVNEGGIAEEPELPRKENCIFNGWYTSDGHIYDFNSPVINDVTLYADWVELPVTNDYFTVTFVINTDTGLNTYDMQILEANQSATEPIPPEKENYNFTGWFTEPELINCFDFNTIIENNTILYAGWESVTHPDAIHGESESEMTVYSITDVKIENNIAIATINVNAMSSLVVQFLNEDTDEEIYTVATRTPNYCEMEEVSIDIDYELPENYKIVVKLFDENGELRCPPLTSIEYTSAYKAFDSKTIFDFAGKTVVNFDDEIDDNFGVLSDNVIVINQDDDTNILTSHSISMFDEESIENVIYEFTNTDDQIAELNQNDVIFAFDTNGTAQLFKIGNIETTADSYIIQPSENNTLEEFYQYLDVDMRIEEEKEDDDEDATPAVYGRRSMLRHEIIDVDTTPTATISPYNMTWSPTEWLSINPTISGSIGLDVTFKYDAKLFGKDYMEASVKTVTTVTISGEIKAEYKNDNDAMREKYKNENIKLPDIHVPTPIAGLSVKVEIGVPIEFSASAKFHYEATYKTTSGFEYNTNSGRQDIDKKDVTADIYGEGEVELKIGPKLEVGIAFLKTVVTASVEVQAGAKLTGTAVWRIDSATTEDSTHACDLCISIEARWFVTANVKLEYYIVEDILEGEIFNLEILNIEGVILLGNYASAYISVIHGADSIFGTTDIKFGFGECPNKAYRTTIKLLNGENEIYGTNVVIKNANTGNVITSGGSPIVRYLHNGTYNIVTKIANTTVTKSFVVSGSAQTITLTKNSADGKINGKILYAENNQPVTDASILITKNSTVVNSLTPKSDGTYSVELPDGTYIVKISKNGYIPFTQIVNVSESNNTYLETSLMISDNGNKRGGFSGRITDAATGEPVANVKLTIRKGWNNPDQGDIVAELKTDSNGIFSKNIASIFGVIFGLECGNYTATTSKTGYAPTSFNILVLPGVVKENQNASISSVAEGNYRVVLEWGKYPSDLDSHMTAYTTSGSYDHIYYSNSYGYTGNLDRDDTNSYGPETITITDFDSLKDGFTYAIHDFTNKSSAYSSSLSASGAIVKLYKGNTLLKTYNVPTDRTGTVWRVFSVDKNGSIRDINYMYNESYPSSVK